MHFGYRMMTHFNIMDDGSFMIFRILIFEFSLKRKYF